MTQLAPPASPSTSTADSAAAVAREQSLRAAVIAEGLFQSGATRVVVAPGSRSTPLVAACHAHPRLELRVVTDERAGAFMALGVGRATGSAGVLITTSGSAAAHAHPAVLEADADAVPLLIISADRPPELLGCGANQTTDQSNLFDGATRAALSLPAVHRDRTDLAQPGGGARGIIEEALHRTRGPHPGPVTLNIQFRKPLEPVAFEWPPDLDQWRRRGPPTQPNIAALDPDAVAKVRAIADTAERGLVVVGGLRTRQERQAARQIITRLGWPVWADVTSGVATSGNFEPLLADPTLRRELAPDVVIHLGGRVVSTVLLDWLAECKPAWIVVGPYRGPYDPRRAVTERVISPLSALRNIPMRPETAWARRVQRSLDAATAGLSAWADALDAPSEIHAARGIAELVEGTLFVASSMPIRDLDRFTNRVDCRVVANRGVSGIDGLVATATGYAWGSNKPVTLMIGDQALLHDVGSLVYAARATPAVHVVAINNGGGGIFSFLPIADSDDPELLERYFTAPTGWSMALACAAFGVAHTRVDARPGPVRQGLKQLARATTTACLEITAPPPGEHVQHHRAAYAAMTAAAVTTWSEPPT